MDQVGEVTSIIQDHVQGLKVEKESYIRQWTIHHLSCLTYLSIREENGLLNTPDVLFISFPFPGIDWDTSSSHSSSSMVLSAENIAAGPSDLKVDFD